MTTINNHTTRAAGTILTAAIYNTDHINHVTNAGNLNAGKIERSTPPVVDGDIIAFLGTTGAASQTTGVNMDRLLELAAGRTLLANASFGAVASVDIIDIPQAFTYLALQVTGASNVNAANTLRVRASDDNGASFAVASYVGIQIAAAGNTGVTSGLADLGANTNAADTHTASIMIFNYQQGSRQLAMSNGLVSGTTRVNITRASGINAINALQIGWTGAGNFDAGSYSLVGIG